MGKRWLNDGSALSHIAGGWQVNTFFSMASGSLVTVTSNANVLNAPGTTTQFADKVKDGPVEIFGDAGVNAQYFDVSAYRSVTQVRFGNSGQGEWRGPTAPNVDMSLFRVFRIGQNKTLQVRAEVFNISNTPHFSNPNTNISNVTFNADGSHQGPERRWRHYVDRSDRPPIRRARVAVRGAVRVLKWGTLLSSRRE